MADETLEPLTDEDIGAFFDIESQWFDGTKRLQFVQIQCGRAMFKWGILRAKIVTAEKALGYSGVPIQVRGY